MHPLPVAEEEIKEMVDAETKAWSSQDVDKLLDLFYLDMVWPWPMTVQSHDPVDWIFELGRFDRNRWKKVWTELFDSYRLFHNIRTIQKIVVSKQGDGAFAVVDVDTLWKRRDDGTDFHWKGRACKIYTKVGEEWKMIAHTGLLLY